ncbi:hypothetical protein [Corynebacterium freiburgense]|uniref:hypothetical protein n=1 Tax=Corynebacterium freiburgense TaxID=556548 RepID=UPI000429EC3B|nr:hypothetical protein [Corynebacterium freiburgense]WJZ01993.1 hypothetical protein CFREI_03450 [Corynebacterium freiburgense]
MSEHPAWVWEITHPVLGHIQVIEAGFEKLCEFDPGFPEPSKTISILHTIKWKGIGQRAIAGGKRSVLVLVDATPTARFERPSNVRFVLGAKCKPEVFSPMRPKRTKNYGVIQANPFSEIIEIKLCTTEGVVFLEPPKGSPAAQRYQEMEQTPIKRLLYPLLGGLGKVGWAILALIFVPLLKQLVGLLPTINVPNIPWPAFHLPAIPWPNIHLPKLPAWTVWALDNSNLWMPLVVGVVIGLIAYRDHKRSRKTDNHGMKATIRRTN